jgi:MFS superfamily sulfate permease-like transporter
MADLPYDLVGGLTLCAIAIPEQIATARLGAFAPQIGLFAFIAGSLAFAAFGASRYLSAGADSTITPIFAGGLGCWPCRPPRNMRLSPAFWHFWSA